MAQIPDDEEVGVEAHAADDAQLVFQPGAQLLVGSRPLLAVLAGQSFLAQGAQIAGRGLAGGHVEDGQVVALGAQIDIAHVGDEQAVVERAGDVAEEGVHFGAGLEVVALVAEPHALRLVDGGAGLDAQQHVVGRGFFGRGVVDVVGGQEAQVVAGLHLHQRLVDGRQFGDAVFLQLDEEAFGAEDVDVAAHEGVGFVHVAGGDGAGDVGGHAAGGADEAVAVGGQKVEVDARLVVVAVELGAAGDLEQVEVAGLVFGQQEQVGALAVELGVAVGHAPGGDVALHADDGLDAVVLAGLPEGHDAEHDAVVG